MELAHEPEITILDSAPAARPVVGLSSAVARDASFAAAVRVAAAQVRPAFDPTCDLSIVDATELTHVRHSELVLAAAAQPSIADVRRALGRGACGVVDRRGDADEISAAMAAAASGLTVLPRDVGPLLLTRLADPPPTLGLEPTDLELLQDLASGMTLDEVALVRDRSTRTIRRELRNLWGRMNVTGRAQGLVLAARWGLVD